MDDERWALRLGLERIPDLTPIVRRSSSIVQKTRLPGVAINSWNVLSLYLKRFSHTSFFQLASAWWPLVFEGGIKVMVNCLWRTFICVNIFG